MTGKPFTDGKKQQQKRCLKQSPLISNHSLYSALFSFTETNTQSVKMLSTKPLTTNRNTWFLRAVAFQSNYFLKETVSVFSETASGDKFKTKFVKAK